MRTSCKAAPWNSKWAFSQTSRGALNNNMQTGESSQPTSTGPESGKTYRGPFAIMTSLFFMWGFMTVFNDILIPRFKEAFTLNYTEAMLVQFAFFGAYFVGS